MYDELYQLFILQKELNVPGIGNFVLNRKPAEANFLEKLIHPPGYSISLVKESGTSSPFFLKNLASLLNIPEGEAADRFNSFVIDLKSKMTEGKEMTWSGIGTLSMNSRGSIKFLPFPLQDTDDTVRAEKVIREHSEHTVLVGERERSSVEMTKLLSQANRKKIKWWITAVIAGLILAIFIFLQFSKNNWNISAASNSQVITPEQEASSYSLLQ